MIKESLIPVILFILLFTGVASAQEVQYSMPAPIDIPLMNRTWELIGKKTFKKISNGKQIPVFPKALWALNNKTVELSGYMVITKMGMNYNTFMLAVVPILQCQFCGEGGIPDMVDVHMNKAVPYSDDPVKFKGKLVLKTPDDYSTNVFLMNAEISK
jgi:hypothetical protein